MNSPASSNRRRLRILLVQPGVGFTSDLRDNLVDAGHLVAEARSGDEAARMLRHRPVNLVLFDGCRDTMTLVELVSAIKGTSGRVSARNTPIFVLTDRPPSLPSWPTYVDGILLCPFSNDALISAYVDFLSSSLNGMKKAGPSRPCCEIDAAIDRLGGDVELYKDLVERFLDDTAGIRQRVELAIESNDWQTLHSAAHSLKGLAASVGAVTAAEALAELEELGRIVEVSRVAAAAQRFRTEMERTADELSDYHRPSAGTSAASRERN